MVKVSSFDRTFSAALIVGIDYNKRIYAYEFDFWVFPILFSLC